MSIIETIKYFRKKVKRTLFTTPSHSQGEFIIPEAEKMLGRKVFECDYSEIDGFDNLAAPLGPIKATQEIATKVYDAGRTFFLTNGSSSGILALMLATLNTGDKVLINRNCHSSVYNGLVLTGAYPLWLDVEMDTDWDIIKPPTAAGVEKTILENSNVKVLIITNPTYEGLVADIKAISDVCIRHKIILIVDEAHGALWNYSQAFPKTAIQAGADGSVQSLHKTAGALNPCALLHLSKNSHIPAYKMQETLNLINTTSPSYPALVDMEATIGFLASTDGDKYIDRLLSDIQSLQKALFQYDNIKVYYYENDITKILIQVDGMSGFALADYLFEDFNIEVELANNRSVLCITGIGTTPQKLNKLKNAVIKISQDTMYKSPAIKETAPYIKPQMAFTPQMAYRSKSIKINVDQAVGCVSKSMYLTYPPGIPILIAGELIQKEHIKYLRQHHDKIKVIV